MTRAKSAPTLSESQVSAPSKKATPDICVAPPANAVAVETTPISATTARVVSVKTMRFMGTQPPSRSCGSRLHYWLPTPQRCPPSRGRGSRPLSACTSRHPTKIVFFSTSDKCPVPYRGFCANCAEFLTGEVPRIRFLRSRVTSGPRPGGDLQLRRSASPHLLVSVQDFAECRLLAGAIVVHERGHHAGVLP